MYTNRTTETYGLPDFTDTDALIAYAPYQAVMCNNALTGPVHNPYDSSRIPGGSSGGSSAVVAARIAPLTVGTDTYGSIRVPATMCGICGLRPSFARYSMGGILGIAPDFLDTTGPLARSVADLALFDSVITKDFGPLQPRSLQGVRIGVARDYFLRELDPGSTDGAAIPLRVRDQPQNGEESRHHDPRINSVACR